MNPAWPCAADAADIPPDETASAAEFWKYQDEFQRHRFEFVFPQLSEDDLAIMVEHYKNRWLLTALVNHQRQRPYIRSVERLTRRMERRFMATKARILDLFSRLTPVQQSAVRERLFTIDFRE